MGDRSGRGFAELDTVAAELDRLRANLARHRRTEESVEEARRMSRDLAEIQAGLRRLADELDARPELEPR